MEPRPRKLLDQVRDAIRMRHYSYRTEESYVAWIRRFILFHNKRHPSEMGAAEIEQFLTYLLGSTGTRCCFDSKPGIQRLAISLS